MTPCKKHPGQFCLCAFKNWVKGALPTDLWLPKDSDLVFGGIDWGFKDYTGYTFQIEPIKFEDTGNPWAKANTKTSTEPCSPAMIQNAGESMGFSPWFTEAMVKTLFGEVRADGLREGSRWDAEDKAAVN